MKLKPIIESLLDTDLYKFNMNQVIFHRYTAACGKYYFKNRTPNVKFTREMVNEINQQIDHLCSLRFKNEELDYLKSIRFIKRDYVEFLRLWHPIRDYVNCYLDDNGELQCVVDGPCFSAMQFEIYLLEIINEVYFRFKYDYDKLLESARTKLEQKIEDFKNGKYTFKFAEFGSRRRLSREWQDELLNKISKELPNCIGTSNVYFAYKYHMKPIGTYAHEFVQMYQGFPKVPLAYTNYYAMKDWFKEYHGDNGTALTDTIGTDMFLLDFDYLNASCYSGVRHDSGDPFEWGNKIINHYKNLGIDPMTKTLLFSDSLNFDKAEEIYQYFKDKCKVSFGIGTYVTNDTCEKALNIVLKLQYINGHPVAKLSDVEGKTMTKDDDFVKYLKRSCDFRLKNHEIDKEYNNNND